MLFLSCHCQTATSYFLISVPQLALLRPVSKLTVETKSTLHSGLKLKVGTSNNLQRETSKVCFHLCICSDPSLKHGNLLHCVFKPNGCFSSNPGDHVTKNTLLSRRYLYCSQGSIILNQSSSINFGI